MSAVKTATATQSLAAMHVHKAGGTEAVGFGRIRTADGTKVFFQSLASGGSTSTAPGIGISPTYVYGTGNSSAPVNVTSAPVSVTVTGGVAPYTYAWSEVSGDAMTATAPAASSTTFTASVPSNGTVLNSVWKCTVTDAAGKSADSATVSVALRNIGGTL